ncbi:MAG: hypothetical protein PVG63_04795 [Anaerolineales bacterium]
MQPRITNWIKPINHILHSPGWLLFLCFVLLFSLTYAGVFRQDDEHILAARAQSLALWGDLDEPQVYGNTRLQALIPLGDKATQIEPLHALAAAPLYRLGLALGGGGTQMMFLLNILVSALCVAAVYAITGALGYKQKTAVWTALLFGAGSMAWPFSATLYRDSLAMLLAGCAWLAWINLEKPGLGRAKWALMLVMALMAGLLAKNTNMALVLAIGVVVGWSWLKNRLQAGRIRSLVLGLAALMGLTAAWAVLVPSSGPLARFSASYILDLARFFVNSLNVDLLGALAGPLISPAKSLFLFSPPLLVGLAGLPLAWRKHRRNLVAGLLMGFFLFLGQGLFYREYWAGTFGWGLRYTLPLIPVMTTLLVGPVVDSVLDRGRSGHVILSAILLVGASVQLAGVLPVWQRSYAQWAAAGIDPYAPEAAWDGRLNAILAGWKWLFQPGVWNTAWVRMLYAGQVTAWWSPIALLATACLTGWVWIRRQSSAGPRLAVSLLVCLLPVVFIPALYRADPAWGGDRPDLLASISWVSDRADSQHPVVIDAYGTVLWMAAMNSWDSPARWYSLAFEFPGGSEPAPEILSPVSRSLFERLLSEAGGLWYVISPEAPDYSYHQEALWLINKAGLTEEQLFGAEGEIRVLGVGDLD